MSLSSSIPGDADLLRRIYAEAKRAGRLDDFYLFHLGFPPNCRRAITPFGNFAHHRGRHPYRQSVTERRKLGGLQRIRLALRQYHCAGTGGPETPTGLSTDPPLHQRHRTPVCGEYAGHCAEVAGIDTWASLVEARAADIKERNLPNALRGRSMEAIACMRLLQERAIYDPVLDGLISAFKYDKPISTRSSVPSAR